jgi:hypothetical protein
MDVQDRISSRVMKSAEEARNNIQIRLNANVLAIFESGVIVKLKALDSQANNLQVISGHDVFFGKNEISAEELLEISNKDFTLGKLRIPGRSSTSQILSGAIEVMGLRESVTPSEALNVARENPGFKGYKRAAKLIALDVSQNKSEHVKMPVESNDDDVTRGMSRKN